MDFKDKYLICVDLDETLLTSSKEISDKSVSYIHELEKNGHLFVLSSGRPFQGLIDFANRLTLTSTPIIASNGTTIIWMDYEKQNIKSAISFPIKKEVFCTLYQEVRPCLDACLASSLYCLYTLHEEKLPFWIIHKNHLVSHQEGEINEILNEDILNATFQVHEDNLPAFLKVIEEEKYDSLFFFCWGKYDGIVTFEVSSKEGSKGHALRYLQELFDIDKAHTIAFGDAYNDLSMIEEANDGVSMCNAPQEIQNHANHVTRLSNNEDGVITYLLENYPSLFDNKN